MEEKCGPSENATINRFSKKEQSALNLSGIAEIEASTLGPRNVVPHLVQQSLFLTQPKMAISDHSSVVETPLLEEDFIDGCVDYKGRPVARTSYGGWRSASFIIGVEIGERFAYNGIKSSLVTYLTGPLGQSTAAAAENVNIWSGTAALLPLCGAFIADSFLGRYRTILIASVIYILGLGLMTLSAALPSFNTSGCKKADNGILCSPPQFKVILFFFSLYLVAFGLGGHKPCVEAFGADQFDAHDPKERKAKSSFFNWWYFGICFGSLIAYLFLNYIDDNISWVLGFGIPCIVMVLVLAIFFCGKTTYRYTVKGDEESPFVRIGRVFILAAKNWKASFSAIAADDEARGNLPSQSSKQFIFLNRALLAPDGSEEHGKVCSIREVEEAKAVLRLIPIWATSLIYTIIVAQSSTFFTKQGATMDRSITSTFKVPAASLQSFISLTSVLFIPIYDCIFVPIARAWTRKTAGITMLQRIGIGKLLAAISMVTAAIVEMKRLETAKKYELVDKPNETIPMSVWWLVPQYVLLGMTEIFTIVGLQEFFYDQVPDDLRSIGLALYLSIFGVGDFLSSFLIFAIENAIGGRGRQSWFSNNLNQAHLDYFYWLLAALSAIEFVLYLYFAKNYIYNRGNRQM